MSRCITLGSRKNKKNVKNLRRDLSGEANWYKYWLFVIGFVPKDYPARRNARIRDKAMPNRILWHEPWNYRNYRNQYLYVYQFSDKSLV